MNIEKILSSCDHTLLSQTATWDEIKLLCEDGIKYNTASVCIPPYYVKRAKEYVGDRLKICTVVGFPNGYNLLSVKVAETIAAVNDGADEIDMVINLAALRSGDYSYVSKEISEIKTACGTKILKVIIETCLLTEEEKLIMCKIVTDVGADYIKTSTGFAGGGATEEDIALMRKNVGERVKVKASGGIASLSDSEKFLSIGADRLGTSRVVKEVKNNI